MTEPSKEPSVEKTLSEHQQLRGLVHTLREFLEQPRPAIGAKGFHTWAASLSSQVVALHDRLFRHFRDEEHGGVFDDIASRNPESSGELQALKEEHTVILAGLREFVDATLTYSEGRKPEDAQLRRRLLSLLDTLGRHEAAESKLMEKIAYTDLGGGG